MTTTDAVVVKMKASGDRDEKKKIFKQATLGPQFQNLGSPARFGHAFRFQTPIHFPVSGCGRTHTVFDHEKKAVV